MVAKGNSSAKRQNSPSIAFGDFEPVPVVLPTKKFISVKGGAQKHRKTPSEVNKENEQKSSELSGGNGVSQAPLPSFYTKNAHARASYQSRRPEACMSPVQLLELRATELAIKRVDLAIQEQRATVVRLEHEREKDRRLAVEHEQQQQQQPSWNADLERQKLRVEEARMRIDEQRARLELAQLQREPNPPPPSVGGGAASTGPVSDGQYRAISAALQLKNAQVRIGKNDPFVDSALCRLGAVDPEVAVALELKRQAELRAELEAVESQRRWEMVKTMGLRPADIVQQIRQRSEVGTESACDRRRDMYTEQALKEAFTAGCQFSEAAADSQTDQNPPSEQWGGYGYPV
jgi:hypothetical protein